jgi:hypothetical protein
MKNRVFKIIIILCLSTCQPKSNPNLEQENNQQLLDYQARGDSIALLAQQTFIKALTKAIADSGTHYAVKFCNLNAQTLIQDLEKVNNCKIGRISNKNRQALNAPTDALDKKMLQGYELNHQSKNPIGSKVLKDKTIFKYYKPITIGMPTCLKCHGKPEQDIETKTRQILQEKYPQDLAIDYQLNDFRGLWKIVFK